MSAAAVSGNGAHVTLTTSAQTLAAAYDVTVASSVKDTVGAGVAPATNSVRA